MGILNIAKKKPVAPEATRSKHDLLRDQIDVTERAERDALRAVQDALEAFDADDSADNERALRAARDGSQAAHERAERAKRLYAAATAERDAEERRSMQREHDALVTELARDTQGDKLLEHEVTAWLAAIDARLERRAHSMATRSKRVRLASLKIALSDSSAMLQSVSELDSGEASGFVVAQRLEREAAGLASDDPRSTLLHQFSNALKQAR